MTDQQTRQPLIHDPDFTLWVGDVLEVLGTMPDGSVDCCVTSPPYWGLRDYGTGAWDGGDPGCDHRKQEARAAHERRTSTLDGGVDTIRVQEEANVYRDVCGKCGAHRVDQQLGLEPTPDAYVENMVAVFREVRRVLAPHGTCWVNLGDSYAANRSYQVSDSKHKAHDFAESNAMSVPEGLKPKDLVGIPWRVAFALQQDGWWLRSDIIWAKPNPMPESVTDRPTKSHEYVFLLSKQPRYFFDQEAVRENHTDTNTSRHAALQRHGTSTSDDRVQNKGPHAMQVFHRGLPGVGTTASGWNPGGRNVRSVWEIATQPFPDAHFATYPEELVRRCVLAGCPEWVCRVCGKPRERIVERTLADVTRKSYRGATEGAVPAHRGTVERPGGYVGASSETLGWTDCGHNDYRPGVVLDPFLGSGTSALVARKHGRCCVGIELNQTYAEMAARRLSQLSLLAEVGA